MTFYNTYTTASTEKGVIFAGWGTPQTANVKFTNWVYPVAADQTGLITSDSCQVADYTPKYESCKINWKVDKHSTFWPGTTSAQNEWNNVTGWLMDVYYHPTTLPYGQYTNIVAYGADETEQQKQVRLATEVERVAAEAKAEDLLMVVLSEEQKLQYRELGYFETAVDDRIYRIKKGRSGNVFQVVDGKEQFKYCAHPAEYVPDQDTMIAQLLMLKNNEAEFLKTANRTVLHP